MVPAEYKKVNKKTLINFLSTKWETFNQKALIDLMPTKWKMFNQRTLINIVSTKKKKFNSAEATCAEIATEMKKCCRLKDMLNFNVP